MKKSLIFFSCLFSLLFAANVHAGFSNHGRMQSKHINLSVGGTLDNQGELIGYEDAKISCGTLSGKGLIQAPEVTIKSKIFAFEGTIHCDAKCVITVGESFNEGMFKRDGEGEFVIEVDPSLWETKSVWMRAEREDEPKEEAFFICQ